MQVKSIRGCEQCDEAAVLCKSDSSRAVQEHTRNNSFILAHVSEGGAPTEHVSVEPIVGC